MTQTTQTGKVLELVQREEVLRPRDLDPYGIPRIYLSRLHAAGRLQRIGRGLYVLPGTNVSEHRSLAEACKRVPKGAICLLIWILDTHPFPETAMLHVFRKESGHARLHRRLQQHGIPERKFMGIDRLHRPLENSRFGVNHRK
ncbi:MAG: type IV toxin-antitoxin system AbiEi family antitoxin domain-containing protein [Gammaproteobacteria bacterium]|nr:type IV toxin-antitoxin system AbiEi family antitoxin domain-containing protein [Gammaproteobacteria bacterium]